MIINLNKKKGIRKLVNIILKIKNEKIKESLILHSNKKTFWLLSKKKKKGHLLSVDI